MEIEHKRVVFDDDVASWLKQYTDALTRIKEWQEVADIARSHLENAMGDAEVAMHNGNEVVRWSFVESKRIDVKKAREILPDSSHSAFGSSNNFAQIHNRGQWCGMSIITPIAPLLDEPPFTPYEDDDEDDE
jgi:hypothetical protein